MIMSLQGRLTQLFKGEPRPRAPCFGLLDLSVLLFLPCPPHRGPAWFVLALVAVSSASTTTSVCRKVFVPGHVHRDLRLLGRHIQPIHQVLPPNEELGGCLT